MPSTASRTDKIIAESNRRYKQYFRKYDPVIGDLSSETVPRKAISLDGTKFYIPLSMFDDPFVKIVKKCKGCLSRIAEYLGLEDTDQVREEIKEKFYDIRFDHDFEFYAVMNLTIQHKITKQQIPFILNPGQIIRRGEQHPHVHLIQGMLAVMSDTYDSVSMPSFTGILDVPTSNSLSSFQYLSGLPMTGELDKYTWKHLALQYPLAANLVISLD